jgi:glycosyltransferase involved in cell wall biosynthesis
MKILFVAMPNSIHTARWISQLQGCGWELHLYPGYYAELHPEIGKVHYHAFREMINKIASVLQRVFLQVVARKSKGSRIRLLKTAKIKEMIDNRLAIIDDADEKARRLIKTIERIKPDIVHSMEFQTNGYLTLKAKQKMQDRFPVWIATNWGSDIFLYGKFAEHQKKIRELLSLCDYYSCETERDVLLAREFGYQGPVLPVVPNSGGFDLQKLMQLRDGARTSQRRIIMLKGYQGWAGRALVGIRALQRCSELLRGYEVVVYLASGEDVEIACRLLAISTGVKVTILSPQQSHEAIMRYHGKARISIGLSISDAISTSFLEAIAMGAFPIQSNTSCAHEWIEDGVTGIIVPPEDPEVIEHAIRKALLEDELVDKAAERNWKTVSERLDAEIIRKKAIGMYEEIYKASGMNK